MARADVALWSVVRVGRSPHQVVARLTARKSLRSGVLWGYVFGLTVASSALGYAAAYKTPAARATFAATFGSNAGLDAITGPGIRLQTIAGYTEWKSLTFLSVIGGVWGLLIATKLLRGEEDSGRLELLLAGQTTKRHATVQVFVGLGCGLLALFVVTALICTVVGVDAKVHIGIASMLFFAVAIVSSAAVFLAIGMLTSQLAATRHRAAGYAGVVLGVSYGLRMIADSGTGLTWLRWTTPLGWVEELQPLTSPHPLALLPIGGFTALLVVVVVHCARTRDLGASILPDRASAKARTRLLFGPLGLAVRLGRAGVLSWMTGIAATALLLGVVAKQAGTSFSSTPSIAKVLHKLGIHSVGAGSYLGLSFLIVAVLVAFVAIGQVTAIRSEEQEGRLEHFLVRPVARWHWLGDRLALGASIVLMSGLIAGLFTWFGTASEQAGIGFPTLAEAGLNLVPPALFIFGLGVFTFGVYPRATGIVSYGVLVWSFLVELVGSLVSSNHWFLDTSVFRQMAAAPAVPMNWSTNGVLILLGILAVLFGVIAFRRRDLVGE